MVRLLLLIISFIVLMFGLPAKAQLNVYTESNALILAKKIIGQGVTITNAQFKGSNVSAAIFDADSGGFPINSGIILTSGRAKTIGTGSGQRGVDGPANYTSNNDASHASYIANQPGDPDLNIFSGRNTKDACVLEFDFIPQGDSINVNYIFASEEYPRYNCSNFNDVFAFLITGPGFPTPTNIAVVPNTGIPVSINSINDGIPGSLGSISICQSTGAGAPFTQYYVSNSGGTVYSYNGRTVVLTAKAKVQPCQVYHIKLAISDSEDNILDSGVFIEAGSFSSKADFSATLTGSYVDADNNVVLVEACKPADLKITRGAGTVGAFDVNVTFGGSATPVIDYSSPPAKISFAPGENEKLFTLNAVPDAFNEGIEKSVMYLSTVQGCSQAVSDSIVILIKDSLNITSRKDTFVCSAFPTIIAAGNPVANTSNTYAWNTGDVTQSVAINQPGHYVVTHTYSQRCNNIDTFNIISGDPVLAIVNTANVICPDKSVSITLNTNATSFIWNNGQSSASILVNSPGMYWVKGMNNNGCYISDTIDLVQRPAPVLELGSDTSLCAYESIRLDAFYPGASYQWNTGENTAVISASSAGKYKVISHLNGCEAADSIIISAKQMPVANAGNDLVVIENGSVVINAVTDSANASYKWTPALSLSNDAIPNPVASPVSTTEYLLKVVSTDGCEAEDRVIVKVIFPLKIPNAFSPNGDNINDTWNIGNIHQFPECKVQIYNRYGQQIFSSSGYKTPWDGSFNGKPLSPATYYYIIDVGNDYPKQGGWVLLLK